MAPEHHEIDIEVVGSLDDFTPRGTHTNDRYGDIQPTFSPDGKTIAFASDRSPITNFETLKYGPLQIATYDLATGKSRSEIAASWDVESVRFSKHGRYRVSETNEDAKTVLRA